MQREGTPDATFPQSIDQPSVLSGKIYLLLTENPLQQSDMKKMNPFTANPFSSTDKVVLVTPPAPVETHVPRTPLRSYLSRPGEGLGALLDSLGGGGGRGMPKKIEVIKRIPVPAVEEAEES